MPARRLLLKLPGDVRAWLARRYQRQHRDWLANEPAGGSWPLTISLDPPTETAAMQQVETVREWANAWRDWRGDGRLEWINRQWRILGTQRLPVAIVLETPLQAAAWLGEDARWLRAEQRFKALCTRWPQLRPVLPSWFPVLADYDNDDFLRLQEVSGWLAERETSGLYFRQLPLSGIDTKWIEPRAAMLADWVAALRGIRERGQDLYQLCGLKRLPVRLRLRILDPGLRQMVGGLGDITAPVADLAQLALPIEKVLIVENLQSGLALQDTPGTVAVMALGYGVDLLAQLPWVARAHCIYWGDIDTHGFAILSRARQYVPGLVSAMMDEVTLLRFSELWSVENVQSTDDPALLTPQERAVYAGLREGRWGHGVRLEQERIDWQFASDSLVAACDIPYRQKP
jgi:hypothetical protein